MFNKMDSWNGIEEYRTVGDRPYIIGNEPVGYLKSVGDNFRLISIRNAGHFVPRDQPEAATQIFNEFLANEL